MVTLSCDLRQRIIGTCDRGEGTQEQIARPFGVSHGIGHETAPTAQDEWLYHGQTSFGRPQEAHLAEHRLAFAMTFSAGLT